MGIDYTTSIGLGRQIKINYKNFAYDKFYNIEEKLSELYPEFSYLLTSQEYKGIECATTLFVGKILFSSDPRDAKTINPSELITALNTKNFTQDSLNKLNQICDEIVNELNLSDNFSEYGVNLMVCCY